MRESLTEGHLIGMGTKRFITTFRVTLFHGIFPTVQVSLSYTHTKHPPPPSRPPRALHTETPPLKKTKKVVVFHAVEPCAAKKKLFLFSLKVDVGAKRRCLLVLGRNFDNKDSCLHVSGCQRATFPPSRRHRVNYDVHHHHHNARRYTMSFTASQRRLCVPAYTTTWSSYNVSPFCGAHLSMLGPARNQQDSTSHSCVARSNQTGWSQNSALPKLLHEGIHRSRLVNSI